MFDKLKLQALLQSKYSLNVAFIVAFAFLISGVGMAQQITITPMSNSVLTTVAGTTFTNPTTGVTFTHSTGGPSHSNAPLTMSNQPGVITVSATPGNVMGVMPPNTSSQSDASGGNPQNGGPNSIWDFISSAQTPEK